MPAQKPAAKDDAVTTPAKRATKTKKPEDNKEATLQTLDVKKGKKPAKHTTQRPPRPRYIVMQAKKPTVKGRKADKKPAANKAAKKPAPKEPTEPAAMPPTETRLAQKARRSGETGHTKEAPLSEARNEEGQLAEARPSEDTRRSDEARLAGGAQSSESRLDAVGQATRRQQQCTRNPRPMGISSHRQHRACSRQQEVKCPWRTTSRLIGPHESSARRSRRRQRSAPMSTNRRRRLYKSKTPRAAQQRTPSLSPRA